MNGEILAERIRRTTRACLCAVLLVALAGSAKAAAQDSVADVRRIEAAALEAYHNLDLDLADHLLVEAAAMAELERLPDSERARLLLDQGVLAIGGRQDVTRGTHLFVQALELDPAARIDSTLLTPEIQSAFAVARSRVAGSARAEAPAPSAVPPEGAPTAEPTVALGPSAVLPATLPPEEPTVPAVEPSPRRANATARAPRFFFHAGYSAGMGWASEHMRADSTIPYDPRFKPGDWNESINGAYAPPGYTEGEWLQAIEATYAGYAPSANGPGDLGTLPTDPECDVAADRYCVRLNSAGFLPTGGLRIELGYFYTERFGVSVDMRFQTHGGLGTLSRVLFSVRSLFQITKPRATGFHSHLFAGLSVGQIQLRADQGRYPGPAITTQSDLMGSIVLVPTGEARKRPWIETGLFGAQVGALFGYRFSESIGLFVQPTFYVLFPKFSFALDATMGVAVTF